MSLKNIILGIAIIILTISVAVYGIKDKIIELIKNSENEGGISTDMLTTKLKENPQEVKEEIQKLLEGGIIFEPRPGKLRWLG